MGLISQGNGHRRRLLLLLACVVFLSSTVTAAASSWRGVDPEIAAIYSGETFLCADGSGVLSIGAVNDDYCDCIDGSDEPGTSACSHGHFYCQNRGYQPVTLSSAFVDDGICDCCDGSDEKEGHCVNSCQEQGRALREEIKKKHGMMKEALVEKSHRIAHIPSVKETWEKEMAKTVADLEEQRKKCTDIDENIRRLEEEQKQNASINATGNQLNDTTPDSDKSEDTPQQDNEEEENDEDDKEKDIDDDGDEDDEKERDDDDEDDALREAYHGVTDQAAEEEGGARRTEEKESGNASRSSNKELSELEISRKEKRDEDKELHSLERHRDSVKRKMEDDYGPGSEFISLVGRCFEHEQDMFSYEICPFDKASQKHKRSSTNLGRYRGFGDDTYTWMEFENGQRCPHGEHRSLKLYLNCGKDDAVLSVTEPNMCQYAANFSTPVVCTDADFDDLTKQIARLFGSSGPSTLVKDEL